MKPQDDNKTTYRLSLWKFKPGSVIQLCHYYSNSDKCFLFCLTFCGRNQAGVIFSWNHRRPYILQCREEGCPRGQDCQTWGGSRNFHGKTRELCQAILGVNGKDIWVNDVLYEFNLRWTLCDSVGAMYSNENKIMNNGILWNQ